MKWFHVFAMIISIAVSSTAIALIGHPDQSTTSSIVVDNEPVFRTGYNAPYTSKFGEEEPKDIQCPIPKKDRVFNYTGIQCVWSSIETLGRWAEEPKLVDPPLTSRSDCKSYASPQSAASVLRRLKVKYEQVDGSRQAGLRLIRKAMSEGRGCLWSVPGHAMVLVHFDEQNDTVKWIDNSDRSLKVQTTNLAGFYRRWDYWVLVIYADNDVLSRKLNRIALPRLIPIRDRNNPQTEYPPDYIPLPEKN